MGANFGSGGSSGIVRAMLRGDSRPILFEQGGVGFQIERLPSN